MERIRNKKASSIAMVLLVIAAGVVALASMPEMVSASNDWYVNSAGGADFLTINQALISPQVQDGDTIYVYYGNGYTECNQVTKSVSIIGIRDPDKPVINAANSNPVFDIKKSDVIIAYLEIRSGGPYYNYEAGIRSGVAATEVNNVGIYDCDVHGFNRGIAVMRVSQQDPYPTSHMLIDNCLYDNGWGIYVLSDPDIISATPNHLVKRSNIFGNIYDGIYNKGDNNYYEDNFIHDNFENGIRMEYSSGCHIYNSELGVTNITRNENGIRIINSQNIDITGFDDDNYLIIYDNEYGISISYSTNIQVIHLNIYENDNGGIGLGYSDGCRISHSVFNYDDKPIWLSGSDSNHFEYNNIFDASGDCEISLLYSDYNIFRNDYSHSFNGHFDLLYSNHNTITNYDFQYIYIDRSDYNEIVDCEITYITGGDNIAIRIQNGHYNYINNTDISGAQLAVSIEDSTNIAINGYVGDPEGLSIIDCIKIMKVRSGFLYYKFSSTVTFRNYYYTDGEDTNDVELFGTDTYSTSVGNANLQKTGNFYLHVDNDEYSTWYDL